MTISDQPPQKKPSASEAAKHFAIPARPSIPPASEQQLPTWKTASNEGYNLEPEPELPAPGPLDPQEQRWLRESVSALKQQSEEAFQPPAQPSTFQSAHLTGPFAQASQPSERPPAFANPASGEPFRGQGGGWQLPPAAPPPRKGCLTLSIVLAVIAVLVVVGGLLGQQLLNNNTDGSQASIPLSSFSSNGPYARLPLNANQINAIQHLEGHMKYKALASLYVSHMSLDDEIGQLIMIEYNQPAYSSDLDYMINTLHVGGVIMYEFQMTSFNQTKGDIAHMQRRSNIPLLISTDEEGGPYVHRLSNIYGYRMSATQIEETGDVNVAKQQGLKTSQDLAALGINEDLAPDVDVNQVNGYDMVTRTFGNTADQVIKYAGAYLQAMQGNGTVACIKHFPGLGGALTDAHKGLPVVHSTKQQIYDTDLAPFKAFIQSPNALLNPGMIMPTDVLLPAIDPKYPAELSHTFMTDILRNEFGYDGVVLTDALYMQGITDTWDMYTASVMALQAGNDMLLGANGTSQTLGVINAIKQALKDGRLTKARIDESVTRIIALKMQYHLMPTYVPGV